MKLTFANGFIVVLQQFLGINEIDISKLIATTRVLTANKTQELGMAVIARQR